ARGPAIATRGSTAALRGGGLLGGSHYAASKGGVISFTKALARELGPRGVRANCVAPGIIETDMTLGKFGENWEQELKQGIPLQRFGSPAEVAQAILFLASDLSSYSTGIVVDVNGGFHIH
ncbi:SDR family oxidoreductase, partial [Achromobacter xylosoxidans]